MYIPNKSQPVHATEYPKSPNPLFSHGRVWITITLTYHSTSCSLARVMTRWGAIRKSAPRRASAQLPRHENMVSDVLFTDLVDDINPFLSRNVDFTCILLSDLSYPGRLAAVYFGRLDTLQTFLWILRSAPVTNFVQLCPKWSVMCYLVPSQALTWIRLWVLSEAFQFRWTSWTLSPLNHSKNKVPVSDTLYIHIPKASLPYAPDNPPKGAI